MSKQDRQGVRTARDIEIKYDLSNYGSGGLSGKEELMLSQLSQSLSQFMANTNGSINELSSLIKNLTKRIERLESGTLTKTTAVLGYATLGDMILGKEV